MSDLTTLANVKAWLGLTGLAIASISKANPAVLTLATRPSVPMLSGVAYEVDGINGMTQLPAGAYIVTVLSPTTFSIPIDSTLFSDYTGGAIVGISDPQLSGLITRVSSFIEAWLNRSVSLANYVENHNGNGAQVMMLDNYPISSVNALTVDGITIPPRPPLGANYGGAYTFNGSPGGYVFDDDSIMISGGCFTRGMQNVTVSYTAGYATTPPFIEQAAIDTIGDFFRYIDRIGKTSQAIETQSTQFTNTPIPVRALEQLRQFKRVHPYAP